MTNKLYYGDNLDVLRTCLANESVAELFMGLKPKLPPLISPVKKASRVETRASHKPGAQGSLI